MMRMRMMMTTTQIVFVPTGVERDRRGELSKTVETRHLFPVGDY